MAELDIPTLAAELAQAVELTMSESASQAARLEAYTACERFKETSPACAEAGLYLAALIQNSPVVRHFGLQLMEHTVKYKWNHISQQEKIFIKENSMKLLTSGGVSAEPHMKDALSRVIVEMVKREWPQQWPSLLAELSEACTYGESQTELVLLIFLRLVEDVALLQTLESNQRRKDIYQALTTNMAVIFEFFLRLIELHVGQFRACTEAGDTAKAASHSRVVQVVLLTLGGFVEWVSVCHIMSQEGRLLKILCLLLNDRSFQCSAADCLIQIVNRKGKIEERKPLLILFSDEAVKYLMEASALKEDDLGLDEQLYLFKKKLIQVLTGLGTQLCSLWGKEVGIMSRPPNFSVFMDAVMMFSSHPSLVLSHMANPLWNVLFKHETISKDSVFLTFVPRWVQCTAPKTVKLIFSNAGLLTPNSTDPNAYLKIDFDSEEEFNQFFHRARSDFLESFRHATMVVPLVTFSYVEQWLSKCLLVDGQKNELNPQDSLVLEWDALSNVLESVLSRVLHTSERPSTAAGLHLLELCLKFESNDPQLLSILLTCISSLFVFLSMSSGQMVPSVNSVAISGATLLPQVLDKIFAALVYSTPGQTKDNRSRAVKNVRRHAASLMVKIGNKYPLLLLPVFDQIRATVCSLSQQEGPAQLSMLERVTLQEALLLISNHFCDYDRQNAFVGEVMAEAHAQWRQMLADNAFKGAREFISYIGLDQPPAEASAGPDAFGQNRCRVAFCLNMLFGAVKRCNCPDDPERAARGGFVMGLTESGNPVCRNPAAPHVLPLLPHVLLLAKMLNELFSPASQAAMSDAFRPCLAMMGVEKANLLGLAGAAGAAVAGDAAEVTGGCGTGGHSPLERMQRFLAGLQESCYHMLGSAGPSLGRDLYHMHGLGQAVVTSVLADLDLVPDFKLRPIIRVFLKPFIHSCPPTYYESVVLPVMVHVGPFMLRRLHWKWQQVTDLCSSGALEENADTQEVLEDILIRALTREYLDLLKVALIGGGLPDSGETDEVNMDIVPAPPSRNILTSEIISELGCLLLRTDGLSQSIIMTILASLAWVDSNASIKATLMVLPIVKQLLADKCMTGGMAAHVTMAILQALTLHGQHEANQGSLLTLGAQMYEMLRPQFADVAEVMRQIPGVNPVDLQKLDERIAVASSKSGGNKVEKVKKDLYRKITGPLIGKSIGQLFRKEVKIAELPRLDLPKKKQQQDVVVNLNPFFS